MRTRPFTLRAARAALAAALLATACRNDSTGSGDEPRVSRIVLTVVTGAGTQTLTFDTDGGQVTGGPLSIPRLTPSAVSAQFLRADGTPDPRVSEATFRLSIAVANPAVAAFAPSGNLGGSLMGLQSRSTALTIALEHLRAGHTEYGPSQPVTVTVQ